jgi:hypothetical protein
VGSPLEAVLSPAGLARAVAASTIGLELYAGVDDAGADAALGSLRALVSVVQTMEGSGPPSG